MSNLKSYIDDKLSDIRVSDKLSKDIQHAATKNYSKNHYSYKLRRGLAFTCIICVLFTGSITALAATNVSVNNWVYSINPALAERLYPINQSSEDNGIKLTVLHATNDNHNAVVYFTMQDTAGKNRISDNLDLCDTCYIDGPTAFNVEILSYNRETQEALFVMRGSGGEGMSNQMTAFKISMLMSNKRKFDWFNTNIDFIKLVDQNAKAIPMTKYTYLGGSESSGKDLVVLEPDKTNISLGDGIDFVTITNMGFIDGQFHIQTKWAEGFDHHGEIRLINKRKVISDEDKTTNYQSYYFITDSDSESAGFSSKHIEFVFDIASIEELSEYNLWSYLVGDGVITKGNWKVNFRLEDADELSIK